MLKIAENEQREFHSYNFNRFGVSVEKIHIHNGIHEIDCTMQFPLLLAHILINK